MPRLSAPPPHPIVTRTKAGHEKANNRLLGLERFQARSGRQGGMCAHRITVRRAPRHGHGAKGLPGSVHFLVSETF